ncbi:MAG: transpeptidase family protein, partial [Prevotellaceae bacterium]|nr:transpeptidase family protein [Prevotellaceae bacterium]
ILANRGNIVAHDGRLLATSIYKYRLFNDLRANGLTDKIFNPNVDTLAAGLSAILKEKTAQEYAKELKTDRQKAMNDRRGKTFRNRPLLRQDVDYVVLKELKELPILRNHPNRGGLIIDQKIRRIHPIESMARNTVGRTNYEGNGTSGMEEYYNKELAGKPGMELMEYTTTWIPISSTPQVEPVDGCDIVSTIDVDMQEMAESVIKSSLAKNPDLEWGTAVIMEVKTGEVRAIVNKKKAKDKESIVEEENYALHYRKDPGSTFKLASFIIMLEKGLKLTDSVNTENGKVKLYEKTFEDEGSRGGRLSVQQVFEKSSNVGTIKLAKEIYKTKENQKDFAERIEALKFKEIVNFDMLHGQRGTTPLIKSADEFSGLTLAMMSIGYELEITPLQTLTLYNAVANNGAMVHPRFLKEIRQSGEVVKKFETQTIHASICSQKTVEKLQQMLLAVVEKGTAKRAQSTSFKIAGKTGTAHIAEGRAGYTNQKLASFAGYFPADAPKYSCIVVFKTYDTYNKSFGGAIAAPAFKEIAEKVYARSIDWHAPITTKLPIAEAPYSKSGQYSALQKVLAALDISAKNDVEPSEWVSTEQQKDMIAINNRGVVQNLVPNVQNMGLQDAIFLLENAGLKVRFSGKGTIKSQSPMPGSTYSEGDVVALALSYND